MSKEFLKGLPLRMIVVEDCWSYPFFSGGFLLGKTYWGCVSQTQVRADFSLIFRTPTWYPKQATFHGCLVISNHFSM